MKYSKSIYNLNTAYTINSKNQSLLFLLVNGGDIIAGGVILLNNNIVFGIK
ncbi:MAG: hypothetical protein IJQ05_02620 [Bacteroidaceae bacterium]|nr:hypothetical protein [Bacteroidaceae bacterium]